jgi:hypothetical protein
VPAGGRTGLSDCAGGAVAVGWDGSGLGVGGGTIAFCCPAGFAGCLDGEGGAVGDAAVGLAGVEGCAGADGGGRAGGGGGGRAGAVGAGGGSDKKGSLICADTGGTVIANSMHAVGYQCRIIMALTFGGLQQHFSYLVTRRRYTSAVPGLDRVARSHSDHTWRQG